MTAVSGESVRVPIGLADLPEGAIQCARCGVATTNPERRQYHVVAKEVEYANGRARLVDTAQGASVEFGLCDGCRAQERHAQQLLEAHPGVVRYLGSSLSVLLYRTTTALDAITAAGLPVPDTLTDAGLLYLLDEDLIAAGGSCRWSGLFSPVQLLAASKAWCSAKPFSHVDVNQLTEVRRQIALWKARQLPPRPVPCPNDSGCVLCGIGSVVAGRGVDVWHPVSWKASPSFPAMAGHLCPLCWSAFEEHPAVGPGLIEAAFMSAIDPDKAIRSRFPGHRVGLTGIRPWAITGRSPSSAPWGHVNVEKTRATLALGPQYV